MTSRPARVAAACLATLIALMPDARPCTAPPPAFVADVQLLEDSFIDLGDGFFRFDIVVKGYKTFGSSVGHNCVCSFELPPQSVIQKVVKMDMVMEGTTVPHPAWTDWEDTPVGAAYWSALYGGNWAAVFAGVNQPVFAGQDVDLLVTLRGRIAPPPGPGMMSPSHRDPSQGIQVGFKSGTIVQALDQASVLALMTQELQQMRIATDEGDDDGEPLGAHPAVTTVGRVSTVDDVLWKQLGGEGSQGGPTLWGSGEATTAGNDGALHMMGAAPNAQTFLMLGLTLQPVVLPVGTLYPSQEVVLPASTDGLGMLHELLPPLGPGVASVELYAQAFVSDGPVQQLSNAVVTRVQR